MTGTTFGRKGVVGGGAAAPARSAFGAAQRAPAGVVAQPEADDPYAAQRAAFLASERVRGSDGAGESHAGAMMGVGSKPVFVREKSVGVAYLLWFFFGAVSAHRFYLGHTNSAIAQASLWVIGWLMVLGGFLFGALGTIIAAIWVLADAFLIPGLARQANERTRERAVSYTFA